MQGEVTPLNWPLYPSSEFHSSCRTTEIFQVLQGGEERRRSRRATSPISNWLNSVVVRAANGQMGGFLERERREREGRKRGERAGAQVYGREGTLRGRAKAHRNFYLCGGNVDVNGGQLRGWGTSRRRRKCPRICWGREAHRGVDPRIAADPSSQCRLFISQLLRFITLVVLIPATWPVPQTQNDGEHMLVTFLHILFLWSLNEDGVLNSLGL